MKNISYSEAERKALAVSGRVLGALEYNPKRGYSMEVKPRGIPSCYPSRRIGRGRFSGRVSV